MATIKFFIQSKNNPAGIYVRLRDGIEIDAKAKTKLAINPTEWSNSKQQPKNLKDEALKKLNSNLMSLKKDLLNHYNNSIAKNQEINSDWLKGFISPQEKIGVIPNNLTDYFDYYLLEKGNQLKKASKTKLNVVKHLIQNFEKKSKRKIRINEVNDNFKNEFLKYSEKEGYSQNTTARNFRFIKTICYDAQSNGIEISQKLKKITMKNSKVEKIFLEPSELRLIEKSKLKLEALINARDWLIISCETGQRVSDFLRFKKEMIRKEKGKHLIEFTQVKTGKIMTIPLSKKVLEILKKRKGKFPYEISDQKYNEYIKRVCEISGLTKPTKGSIINPETKRKENGIYPKWKLVSSHIGRRSFATNNYGRIPTSLLIGATGHSSERQFLEYIGKSDSQKALQLAEYF